MQDSDEDARSKRVLEKKLDDQLADTFPASDPLTLTLPQADKLLRPLDDETA